MKIVDMQYIETPISPSSNSRSSGIDERLLSDKLDIFLRSRKVRHFSKLLKRLTE